ncbi:phosphotransferase [Vallitalea pronyensis]|uniref:Phosphotransferase n=1 Tax=Vallitalea pronyensis TaxID=1348613 RepID=A0A8J8MNY3_9FIRM|nr:phosphotransferase [Vallitalea pronyensis]QUI24693.1 phosphotransferase [Vallitalea pronyensis]
MLKLKYLEDNRDLVMTLLDYWVYDEESLSLLNEFRISSNAIYPYKAQGNVHLLRFSPNAEKIPETILAELEYLEYLQKNNYLVPEIIPSKNGNTLEIINTSWGVYSAAVFKHVKGEKLDRISLTDQILFGYGKALGELHVLSQKYKPKVYKRISHEEQLDVMLKAMTPFKEEEQIRSAIKALKKDMKALIKTQDNYGLIHYDYELDNVFYEKKSNKYYIIDFDDAVYHYYMMDIVKCKDNILEEHPEMDEKHVVSCFLEGYTSVKPIDKRMLDDEDVFKRYYQLYSYVRCRLALAEPIDNPPEWMVELTHRIENYLKEIKGYLII